MGRALDLGERIHQRHGGRRARGRVGGAMHLARHRGRAFGIGLRERVEQHARGARDRQVDGRDRSIEVAACGNEAGGSGGGRGTGSGGSRRKRSHEEA